MNGIDVGDTFAKSVLIDDQSIRSFATLAGDMNPLHHDDAAAAAGPYGGLIASGPQLLSLLLGVDATHFSSLGGLAVGLGFDFKFVKALPVDTRVVLAWTVTGCDFKPSLAGWIVSVEGSVRDETGTLYVSARGSNLVRERTAPRSAA